MWRHKGFRLSKDQARQQGYKMKASILYISPCSVQLVTVRYRVSHIYFERDPLKVDNPIGLDIHVPVISSKLTLFGYQEYFSLYPVGERTA